MVAGAAEPSAKRAKVDEADEEEDPLVRRKEEVVRLLERASAKGKGNARAKKELSALCADFEAKNDKLLGRLPPELWQKIVDEYLHPNDLLALAMTCRFFREKQKDLGKKVETNLNMYRLHKLLETGKVTPHTLGWFQWVCDNWEILPGYEWISKKVQGAVYEGDLLNYAAFQGSVEILSWLLEEKGWELNRETSGWAGMGGSVEILEYLNFITTKGRVEFNEYACYGAARRGHVEALKYLRGLDPPCPWNEMICAFAALGGHLEVLKWARSQDPPCPWSGWTCKDAAKGGHLDILKWVRSQNPPCPWSETTCSQAAEEGRLDVLKWLRSQAPPCPWDWRTCSEAATGGHLEVLKWLRSQDPPCPWSRSGCREVASERDRQHIVDWIDQQEDESDEEYWGYSDNDSDIYW